RDEERNHARGVGTAQSIQPGLFADQPATRRKVEKDPGPRQPFGVDAGDDRADARRLLRRRFLKPDDIAMTFHQHHTGDGVDAIAAGPPQPSTTFTTATLPPGAEPSDGVDLEYRRLFASFGQSADGHISRKELFSKLHQCGVLVDDPRIQE